MNFFGRPTDGDDGEQAQPLLTQGTRRGRETMQTSRKNLQSRWRLWKASPYWLIPVVITVSMCRGLTMAPRIQVYNHIACQAFKKLPGSLPLPSPSNLTATIFAPAQDEDCPSADIQPRAAQIQATIITSMSVLSAITTGLWSRFGDIHGRKIILCSTIFGFIAMDIIVLLVTDTESFFSQYGEQFIVLGPIIDGLLGGLSAFNGVVHAYTSDCTPHGSRSKIFSTIQGIVFIGLASGPWVGSILLRLLKPSESMTFMFYLSILFQIAILTFILLLLPESLKPVASEGTRTRPASTYSTLSRTSSSSKPFLPRAKVMIIRFMKTFISPITMFGPKTIARGRRDWNLTLVGMALFLYVLSSGVYQVKYLYAKHIYVWTAEQLSFYMSLLWITRAANLLVVLPLIISYFKPPTKPRLAVSPVSPLSPVSPVEESETIEPERDIPAELRFDQKIAGYSLFVDGFSDFCVFLAPISSQSAFIFFSCLTSFTSGGNPAVHSLGAVCLHAAGRGSEVGSLFGALAVLSAIAHTFSPTIYAATYGLTVVTFPKAVFLLASIFLAIVVTLLWLIKPDNGSKEDSYSPITQDEEEAVTFRN
ncbi:hypothetical protein EYR40_007753 [Pleurotus pulmonarius]|nr:hypothetical protein EYR38_007934 [Pleurotus pulmonarius]KAF4597301.1 hypothetical protein EYR40_007753 [Pleurotus pulmonarius]